MCVHFSKFSILHFVSQLLPSGDVSKEEEVLGQKREALFKQKFCLELSPHDLLIYSLLLENIKFCLILVWVFHFGDVLWLLSNFGSFFPKQKQDLQLPDSQEPQTDTFTEEKMFQTLAVKQHAPSFSSSKNKSHSLNGRITWTDAWQADKPWTSCVLWVMDRETIYSVFLFARSSVSQEISSKSRLAFCYKN
jgi:hypothetical protein